MFTKHRLCFDTDGSVVVDVVVAVFIFIIIIIIGRSNRARVNPYSLYVKYQRVLKNAALRPNNWIQYKKCTAVSGINATKGMSKHLVHHNHNALIPILPHLFTSNDITISAKINIHT